MIKNETVCVIIPAYNEETTVGQVVSSIKNKCRLLKINFEIVVVDDGSTDNTSKIAGKAGATVINHIINSGPGSAVATGISYANQNGYAIAATMDADDQHSPDDVINGINYLHNNDFDLVIGSRLMDPKGMPKTKIIGNKGLSLITYMLFGTNTSDSQSGLRIYSAKALDRLKWKSNGYEYTSEMLWRAKQLELKIAEYPIRAIYTQYSRSKGQNNWNAINIVKSLFKRRITEIFE